jgi:pectinesterase inhibitor-like protein
MKYFFLCFFVLPLALCSPLPRVSHTPLKLVDEVCNKLVHINEVVTPDVCLSVFQHDSRSRTATDYHALGLILVNLTTKSTTEAIAGMKHVIFHTHTLLNQEQNAGAQACIRDYEAAIPSLQATTKSLKIKNYKLAQSALLVARSANSKCVDEVKFDDEENMIGRYIWKFRSFFPTAIDVLVAMTQFLVNTYEAH